MIVLHIQNQLCHSTASRFSERSRVMDLSILKLGFVIFCTAFELDGLNFMTLILSFQF